MTGDTGNNIEGVLERQIAASRLFGQADPSQRIGRFVPLRLLGKGGMGAVFSAYDERLDRRVALKVLRAGRSGAADATPRMLREAQAMAKLSHPNVVQIHEVGEYQGQLFIAMEYIEGRTLTAWLKERRRNWREILPVFLSAGEGLHAAHLAGLVHRDFKPDNVMLGDDGRVRVMDFGLALVDSCAPQRSSAEPMGRARDDRAQVLTETGTLLGTPGYIAPEQRAGGPVDAKADQFAFCVALYQALYRVSPFDDESVPEAAGAKEVGGHALTAQRAVPAWIHRAIKQGLEEDPRRRFLSMAALLAALRDDPGRRRWGIAAVGLVVFSIAGAWGWQRFDREQRAAECNAEAAQTVRVWNSAAREAMRSAMMATGLPFAARSFDFTAKRLDRFASEWSGAAREACFQAQVLGVVDSGTYQRAQACLGERLISFAEFVSALSRADRGTVLHAVTAVTSLPNVSACRDRRELWRMDVLDGPGVAAISAKRALARASALELTGDLERAAEATAVAEERARALGAPVLLGQARVLRGKILSAQGRPDAARERLESAYLAAVQAGADEVAAHAAQALVFVVGHEQSNYEDALLWGRLAEVAFRRTSRDGPPRSSGLLSNLAIVHHETGDHALARSLYRQALAQDLESYGSGHPEITTPLTNLGLLHIDLGELVAAHDALRAAYDLSVRFYGADHPETARAGLHLGLVYQSAGAYEEAEASFRRAVAIVEKTPGLGDAWSAVGLNSLAAVHQARGDYVEAQRLFQAALRVTERAYGTRHVEYASALNNLGAALEQLGRQTEALACFQGALALRLQLLGPQHPLVARSLFSIGLVYQTRGSLDEAGEYFERARIGAEHALGPNHPDVALALCGLATVAEERERFAEARDLLASALRALEASVGEAHPNVAAVLVNLGDVLLRMGDPAGALDWFTRARSVAERTPDAAHADLVAAHTGAGEALMALKRPAEAIDSLERALLAQRTGGDGRQDIADTQVALAEALWAADRGDQRASALIEDACATYEALGEPAKQALSAARAVHALHARKRAPLSP